ncbi:hypothetical protein OH77DRAFT_1421170 [Trametes cingulata]|nr:hypothetical protein OH77DRAFT_1421170 [Trametes cingulata]
MRPRVLLWGWGRLRSDNEAHCGTFVSPRVLLLLHSDILSMHDVTLQRSGEATRHGPNVPGSQPDCVVESRAESLPPVSAQHQMSPSSLGPGIVRSSSSVAQAAWNTPPWLQSSVVSSRRPQLHLPRAAAESLGAVVGLQMASAARRRPSGADVVLELGAQPPPAATQTLSMFSATAASHSQALTQLGGSHPSGASGRTR